MINQVFLNIVNYYFPSLEGKKKHEGLIFVLKFLSLFALWKIVFFVIWRNNFLLNTYNHISLKVIDLILISTRFILEILGYTTELVFSERIIRIKDTLGVSVGEPCIGYEVTAIFVGLILASKGSLLKKIWFIPFGATIIYLLNLIRICALAMLVSINQVIWEINHKFVFSIVVYTAVFFLWRLWFHVNSKNKFILTQE